MGRRHLARELALRILFQFEAAEPTSAGDAFSLFCRNFAPNRDEENSLECDEDRFNQALPYAQELFFGVINHLQNIDQSIAEASQHWRMDRMSRVDRNVLRLAVYEMRFRQDVPHKVSINEAIELGKEFGTEESKAFINGILDRIHHHTAEVLADEDVS
ncbi:MAG: transcription antitermination factor NusB [Deltaproteobacteria bacterium]|nr:transcription antitermination factor NusB [Deltaproteobacteria bacterium]